MKVIFTNGAFDLLHAGHRSFLRQAAELGGLLIVAVNTDASVKRLKGDSRPVHTCATRIESITTYLEALPVPSGFIVVPFEADTPEEVIREMQPDVLVKGDDTPRPLAGEEFVLSYGGSVHIIPRTPGISTTELIKGGGMSDCIHIIRPGTPVSFLATKGDVSGHVVAVQLGASLVPTYLVSWWDMRNRKEEWVSQQEIISVTQPSLTKIGFAKVSE
jgi:rfaE bifunctional protein nucleotidyltransferase chain/domain